MSRTMQDSVNARALLPGADFYAGYVDGRVVAYHNVDAIRARFPRARVLRITVTGGSLDADIGDVEKGDMTPQSGAAWAKRKHARGDHPTIYCNTSTRPSVEAACHALGLALHRDYEIWEAHYPSPAPTNPTTLPAGAVAWQYRDHGPHGENVDMSVVADYWPGIDPKPAALPTWFHRSLDVKHPYESGPDVHRVQRWLINHGFLPVHDAHGRGNDDGVYGPASGAAVKAAKSKHGLHPDTHVGSALARIIG